MTHEHYIARLKDLEARQKEIKDSIVALQREWLEYSPYKPGDKVRVKVESAWGSKMEEHTAFINSVRPGLSHDTRQFIYGFQKMKKDGTPHNHELHTYGRYEVLGLAQGIEAEIPEPKAKDCSG